MIRLKQAVVVEGRYDKIKLQSFLDATIIETNGFRIFRDKEKIALLNQLAARAGLVVLTDSDRAGFRIRAYLKSCVRQGQVYHAYIPEILGKESRKSKPSAEGTLGVEGMEISVLREALERAGVTACQEEKRDRLVTKADLFRDGLSGGPESRALRTRLLARLGLPKYLSANSMLDVLNTMFSYEEYQQLVRQAAQGRKTAAETGAPSEPVQP